MKRLLLSCLFFTLLGIEYSFAQVDFRKESIYFLLVSRFYDGDSTNNRPNEWCSYLPGVNNPNITDPKDVTWRGDFKGLIEKLDYIKDMGFTAIWINPVVQGRSPLDYHGYHAWDFTKVDTRLQSPGASFKDLIDAAHAKGLKIILDIVTNHSGRYGIKGVSELKYNTDPTKPWGQNSTGQSLQDNPNWEYDGSTPNPDDNKIWSRANLAKMPPPFNQNLANYNWPSTQSFLTTSDPNWFHHWGNGFVQGWDDTTNCYNGAISDDCPDLNTGSQAVQDYFFNAYKQYIDWGVDAFRWDTYKHMSKQDIQVLLDRFKAYKPDLFVFGEVAQKRFELHQVQELNPHWYTWRGDVGNSGPSGSSVLDFYAEATFHNIFENGGGFSGVTDAARYDYLYNDPSQLVTWLDNHDFGPNNDWNRRYGGSDENLAACMNFMFTWRGIPSVYYGTETRFKSGAYTDLHDAAGIRKSIDETGRAYYGNSFTDASNHIIYRHIKKLNAIRKAIPALQNGSWQWAGNAPWNGIGYTRTSGSSFVCVGLAKDGAASFSFNSISNGMYRDAVTGREINVTNGTLAFTITSGSAGIYVKDGPGMIGESGAGFFEPCANSCNNQPPTARVSPVGTNYNTPQTVSITATGSAPPYTLYYTTNGTTPTTSSTVYTSPISISTATTVKAIAKDVNGRISEIDAQRYTFVKPSPTLNITPVSGNYYDAISINAIPSGGTAPYIVYYTTDGSVPTRTSAVLVGTLSINAATTFKAIVKDANDSLSSVVTRSYTFNIPAPDITATPAGGNFNGGSVAVRFNVSSPRPPVRVYYTTDHTTPTSTNGQLYADSIVMTGGSPDTLLFMGIDEEGRSSEVDTAIYTYYPIPDIAVYFKRPANWSNTIKIHFWNGLPAGVYTATTWPGVNMTQVCGDWYKFTFSGITSTNLIFNDGAGKQTANLSATQTACYDNGWLISIPNIEQPVANFSVSPSLTGTAPYTVTFNGSLSTACAGITGYAWDFGNGLNNTGQTPSTTYTNAGNYQVKLVITDQNGVRDSIIKTIQVNSAADGFWVYFKKPASWGNNIKVHYWNRMPGSGSTTWPGTTMTSHCANFYKYFFSNTTSTYLIFNDGAGKQTIDLSASRTCTFDSNRLVFGAPEAEENLFANFEMSQAVGINPIAVNFTTSTLINCSGDPITYNWDFGDGGSSTLANPSHTYTNAGRYTVTLLIFTSGTTPGVSNISKEIYVGQSGNTLKVHYRKPTTWTNTPNVYFWNAVPTSTAIAWPGTAMTSEGNNWWKYESTTAQCANVIFNNNSSPQSTDLLNVCGEVWYDNGWISSLRTSGTVPLKLISFTGSQKQFLNELEFTTSSENQLRSFEIERSDDGVSFRTIGMMAARNTSYNRYRYEDRVNPDEKDWYYRLKVIDNQGAHQYSKVIRLQNLLLLENVTLFPNPAYSSVQIKVSDPGNTHYILRLFDMQGKLQREVLLSQKNTLLQRGAEVSSGVYFMQILNKKREVVQRGKLLFR